MAIFTYKAIDRSGKEISGQTFSTTKDELVARLGKDGLYLITWKEIEDLSSPESEVRFPDTKLSLARKLSHAWRAWDPRRDNYTDYKQIRGSLNAKTLATITWQMSIGLKSGITLAAILNAVGNETLDGKVKYIFNFIYERINSGHTLADSLAFFPSVFSVIYINMVRAGEAGGFLPRALEEASAYLKKQDRLNKKIRSMMIYPIMLTVIASCIIIFMATFIMPIFAQVFAGLNVELPLLTRMLLLGFGLLRKFIFVWLGLLVVAVYFAHKIYKNIGSNLTVDRLILKIPFLGVLLLKLALSRFLGTLAVLLKTSVSILDSLVIGKAVAGNAALALEISEIYKAVQSGKPLAEKMTISKYFPSMVAMMVSNGEKSGNLPEALDKVTEYYIEEVDIAVSDTLAIMEPLIVVVMGFSIALIASGLLLPMFDLPGYIE